MEITDALISSRRYLKRRNFSAHTIKNYMNRLKHFIVWVDVPLEQADYEKVLSYVEWLIGKRLTALSINAHLFCISGFYQYLTYEKGFKIANPVKKRSTLRVPKPLPRFVKDEELSLFFKAVKTCRDRAMFMLMLRCGLRVEEVAHLKLPAIDLKRRSLMIIDGKGGKSRVVYLSTDACDALVAYLRVRKGSRTQGLFLVDKGACKGQPISVRGIQKRMEYYARMANVSITCHQLRHTMATQMLNADAQLETIQDLLGHSGIITTQRYCKVSNMKVKRDYYKAMEMIMTRTTPVQTAKKEA
jgi:site-specific recombinase XerD